MPVTYARRLGLFDGTMVVVGGIIGAGIFLNPAIVAQRAPSSTLILASWGIGGAIALAGAFIFAELGARRPEAGGGYVYLRDVFGPLPAFLYGWTLLLVINTGGIAAVAITFARYATELVHLPLGAVRPLAVGAIFLLSAVNYVGVRPGATTQNVMTLLKLVALTALIIGGLLALRATPVARAPAGHVVSDVANGATGLVAIIGAALIPILFSYGGWQHANHIAGEIARPRRNLPRALIIGVAIVVVVYLLANVAYLAALGPAGLAASLAPAADTLRVVMGETGARLIAAGIVISTFGITNLFIMAGPRVYQTMADDGAFFRSAARLHPRFRTPHRALVFQAVWAALLTLSGTYAQLLDYVVFGDWIFFGLVGLTLFGYRRGWGRAAAVVPAGTGAAKRPVDTNTAGATAAPGDVDTQTSLYLMPGYPLVPALFVLAAAFVVASSVASNPRNAAIGALLIGAGVPAFVYWRRRAAAPAASSDVDA